MSGVVPVAAEISTSNGLDKVGTTTKEMDVQQEAEITINGTKLTDNESMVVRLALATFADVLATQLGFKDAGIALTDRYQADVAHVRALIDGNNPRIQ
jgi:hypothetical protein